MKKIILLLLLVTLAFGQSMLDKDEDEVRIRSEVEAEEMTGEKALTEEEEKQLNDFLLGLAAHAIHGTLGAAHGAVNLLGHVLSGRRNLRETSVAQLLERIRSEVEAEEMTGEKALTEEEEKQLNDFFRGIANHYTRNYSGYHRYGRRNLGETSVAQMLERIRSEVEAEEMTGEKALTARTKMPSALAIWGRRNLGETSVAQMLERN